MTNEQILQKLEYIHFALQEAQQLIPDNPEVENAIYSLEDVRELFFEENQKSKNTKVWSVKLEIAIDENNNARRLILGAIEENLNFEAGEDIIDYDFICLD